MRRTACAVAAAAALVVLSGETRAAAITNGSFETGDFTGWGVSDLASPFLPLAVRGDGFSPGLGLFSTAATDGLFSATHGFDGVGPGTIRIYQDIGTVNALSDLLTFDYRAGWDMQTFSTAATLDRVFSVNLYEAGSFASQLASIEILRLPARSRNVDTGNLLGSVDLSSFSGQAVRVSFDAFVPESLTGPAFFQLDNVQLSPAQTSPVPEPASLILLGGGALGLIGFGWSRRKVPSAG